MYMYVHASIIIFYLYRRILKSKFANGKSYFAIALNLCLFFRMVIELSMDRNFLIRSKCQDQNWSIFLIGRTYKMSIFYFL